MTQTPHQKYPVVIAGAGPVGLALANLLGQRGVDVVLLEKRADLFTLPRAIAYDAETLRLFQGLELSEAIAPWLRQSLPVHYYDGRGRCFQQMTRIGRPYGHSAVGTFYQPAFEQVLREGLARWPTVDVRFGHEVLGFDDRGDRAAVTVRNDAGNQVIDAAWVIACDGGGSGLRERAGIGFGGTTFAQKWLVVDTIGEGYGRDAIEFFCDPARPALTMPVVGKRRRWEFLMLPGESEADLVEEKKVRALIAGYAPEDRSELERAIVYTFHARLADRYRAGRLILAGDAAHIMPPFAGQGLNSGMRDVANLAWKLELVWRGQADTALLDSYEAERRHHVRAMTRLAIRLGNLIMPTSRSRAALRHLAFAVTNAIPGRQARVDRGALVPAPVLPRGCPLGLRSAGNRSGEMLIQPMIPDGSGQIRMLDDLLGEGWAVIGLGVEPSEALHEADRRLIAALGARGVRIDGSPELAAWAGPGPRILLVRPDRYVAAAFEPGPSRARLTDLADALQLVAHPKRSLSIAARCNTHFERAAAPVVRAIGPVSVLFERPDLDQAERFLSDFGLVRHRKSQTRLMMGAAGDALAAIEISHAKRPRFVGLALAVGERGDLDRLAGLAGAGPIESIEGSALVEGAQISLRDPAGFLVRAVWIPEAPARPLSRAPLPVNRADSTLRLNEGQRPAKGPATIIRLGHIVLNVVDFAAVQRWYLETFGLIATDIQTLADGSPAVAFMRTDRGDLPVDHHSLVIAQNVVNGYSHSAYEVIDLDDMAMGNEHLLSRHHKHAWGIGRHLLGSQLFDYWRDPWGEKFEHFVDSDRFDASHATGWSELTMSGLSQWGPPLPADFEKPRITPKLVATMIGNVRRSRELDWAKVRLLMKTASGAPQRRAD